MPQVPDLIHLAIPGFILLLLLEAIADAVMRRELYELKDTGASLTMGVGNVIIGLGAKAAVLGIFAFVYKFAIFNIGCDCPGIGNCGTHFTGLFFEPFS